LSFDTTTFWIFFVLAWVMWRFLPFGMAKSVLLFMSLAFYGWWSPMYVPLIILSSIVDYAVGAKIYRSEVIPIQRLWLIISLICNLGILCIFKYGPFLMQNFAYLGRISGIISIDPFENWIIPVGISFYTFQSMSYSIDIYRGKMKPAKSFRDFFLFVSFFPQLVAGPIVRAHKFMPQLTCRPRLSALSTHRGLYYIIWGMFMKVVVADNLAIPVDYAFNMDNLLELSPAQAWMGLICFSNQIFADFAGYSSIAIGLAYLMGLRFPTNFNYPYISASFSEFWTRWHITLSQWLRDYLYISLGGNRKGNSWLYFNLIVTMLLGGLWHGPSWTFVIWGGLHGLSLCIERLLHRGRRQYPHSYAKNGTITFFNAIRKLLGIMIVFLVVQVTWVFFRAESITMSLLFLKKMFVSPFTEVFFGEHVETIYFVLLIPVFIFHLGQLAHEWFGIRKTAYRLSVIAGIMLFLLLVVERSEEHAFIYFQF